MKRKTIAALLKQILTEIACRQFKNDSSTECEQVYAYIAGHYSEHITNRTIAEALHYHPNYLSARMCRETGMSLHENLMRYRIRMALVLLENTELPVEEISTATGFCTASHFTVCFRRITGPTPSQYRTEGKTSI